MRKISSPRELQHELETLLSYAGSDTPSRARIALRLEELAQSILASELLSLSENVKVASTDQFDRYIQLAADDIKSLRKSDVYRVLEQAKTSKELSELAAYIGKKNPSLKSTVTSDADEVMDDKGWAKTAVTP